MGDKDKVKVLRNENDQLKRQLEALKNEFEFIKTKMAEQMEPYIDCSSTR